MAATSLNEKLRTGTPLEIESHLKDALQRARAPKRRASTGEGTADSLTVHLLASVESGAIAPSVLRIYLPLCRDPPQRALVAALRQTHSVSVRRAAMQQLTRALRSAELFAPTWAALGGPVGVAGLMQQLGVRDVKLFCRALGATANAEAALAERQAQMAVLLQLLTDVDPETRPSDSSVAMGSAGRELERDPRPLRRVYKQIVPAATSEVCLAWKPKTGPESVSERALLNGVHREAYEAQYLAKLDGERPRLRDVLVPMVATVRFTSIVLQRLASSKPALAEVEDADEFVALVAVSVARRLRRHPLRDRIHTKAYDLIIACLRQRPASTWKLSVHKGSLIYYAARWWHNCTRHLSPEDASLARGVVVQLTSMLHLSERDVINGVTNFLPIVPCSLRYELLQLLFRRNREDAMDISPKPADQLDAMVGAEGNWPLDVFKMLPTGPALALLDRLINSRGTARPFAARDDHSSRGSTFLVPSFENNTIHTFGDETILKVYLLSRSSAGPNEPEWLDDVKREVEAYKKKAAQSREYTDRAAWAGFALDLCIATSSLSLYSDTLMWARRFNADPRTVKLLYGMRRIKTNEGIDMLAAVRKNAYVSKKDVTAANQIILDLLETSDMGLRQPSFSLGDWDSVRDLPRLVANRRLAYVNGYQDRAKVDDDAVFAQVWEPTLDMLLQAEAFSLAEGHERFSYGRIGTVYMMDPPGRVRLHTVRFLDELARRRDEMWRMARERKQPAVMTLKAPWPRGLAVQSLLPLTRAIEMINIHVPYVYHRAVTALFPDSEAALQPSPEDEEQTNAIGTFVNSYKYAFRIYLNAEDLAASRTEALQKVWTYATTQLTGDRMTEEEAYWFWGDILDGYIPQDKERLKHPEIEIPRPENPSEPTEWNPDPSYEPSPQIKERTLRATCLDSMFIFGRDYGAPDLQSTFLSPALSTKEGYYPSFWAVYSGRALSAPARDAVVAVALLTLNSSLGADTSLLMKPFPTPQDSRFPALYLDQEFLERKHGRFDATSVALSALRKQLLVVPPGLLAKLVASALTRLRASPPDSPYMRSSLWAVMMLIRQLARSDRPELACPFVRDVVLEWQEYSAWHRMLFNAGFLASLSARKASNFLGEVASAICEKLKLQREQQAQQAQQPQPRQAAGETEAVKAEAPKPAVKVTTVKILAEILRTTNVLGPVDACMILETMLKTATHIDILVAVVGALLELLSDAVAANNASLQDGIMGVLANSAVPIASSLHERHLMTEEDWRTVEQTPGADMPVVWTATDGPSPPILDGLMRGFPNRLRESQLWEPRKHQYFSRTLWLDRIVTPLWKHSIANNRRWTALFIRKNGFGGDPEDVYNVPACPVHRSITLNILSTYHTLNHPTVSDALAVIHTTTCDRLVHYPPSLPQAIMAFVCADKALAHSNAGKHWIGQWGDSLSMTILSDGPLATASLLAEPATQHADAIATLELAVADHLLARGEVHAFDQLATTVSKGSPMAPGPRDEGSVWPTRCLPVLRALAARASALRTPAWQRGPYRTPARLPDVFAAVTVKMLAMPAQRRDVPAVQLDGVAREIGEVVDMLVAEHAPAAPYHVRWEVLKREVQRRLWDGHYAAVAVRLGRLEEGAETQMALALSAFLRAELAAELLAVVPPRQQMEPAVRAEVRAMLRGWQGSPVETLREWARRELQRRVFKDDGQ